MKVKVTDTTGIKAPKCAKLRQTFQGAEAIRRAGLAPNEKPYPEALAAKTAFQLEFTGIEELTKARKMSSAHPRPEDTVTHVYKDYSKSRVRAIRRRWKKMLKAMAHGLRSSSSSVILVLEARGIITAATAIKLIYFCASSRPAYVGACRANICFHTWTTW